MIFYNKILIYIYIHLNYITNNNFFLKGTNNKTNIINVTIYCLRNKTKYV